MKRLWFNGIVISMDSDMRQYEAIGVENEHIIFLGDNVDALQQAWDEQIDLKGAMILPGFHDTHMHLLNYAMFQKDVALFGIKSIEEIIVLCQERIAQRHPNYLLGIGWDQEIMAEGRMPTRADMDRLSTEYGHAGANPQFEKQHCRSTTVCGLRARRSARGCHASL